MINSSLILLLKNFDKQQLKEFNSYVRSPYFNTNKALVSLYEYIRKQHPDFTADKLDKKYVYKKIFGKTEFNDGFFRVLMSNLQRLAEEYLSQKGYENESLLKKKLLLDKLMSFPDNKKLAEKILKEGLKEAGSIKPEGPDDFLSKYHMAFYRKYIYSKNFSATKDNLPSEHLYDEQKYLTFYFLLRMLADHFYHLNQSQIINYTPKLVFVDEIITFLEKNPDYLEFPTLNMAYLRVLLLKNNNINDLYRLKDALYLSFHELGHKDCFNIISIIINFCHKNYFLTEDKKFLEEKLEILLFGLKNGITSFDKDDYFDSNRYNNLFSTLIELDQLSEAEAFINEYGGKLAPEEQNFWVNYSLAEIKSKQGNFDEALDNLSKIRSVKDFSGKFILKTLQLRLYYDAGLTEQALSSADSFRHFIQKENLMNPVFNEQFRNFYTFYLKLPALNSRRAGSDINESKARLSSVKNVVHKKWLLDRL